MRKYITSDILIEEVMNELPTYFETGKVDRSILMPVINECVAKMGVGRYKEGKSFVEVNGYCGNLPSDFYQICLAVSCIGKTVTRPDHRKGVVYRETELCEIEECDTFRVHLDDCGNMYKIEQHLPYESFSWNEYNLLSIEKTSKPHCQIGCPNLKVDDPYEIDVRNGKMFTNFPSGTIYLEYLLNPNTPEGIEIPDQHTIRKWIKDEMKTRVLEYLYDNMEPNIEGRLQNSQRRSNASHIQAMSVYKRPEFYELYELRNRLAARYNARARSILYGKYCQSTDW